MKNLKTKNVRLNKKSDNLSPNNYFYKASCEIIHNILNPVSGLILYLELNKENDSLQKIISPISVANEKIREFIQSISQNLNNKNQQEIINIENHILDLIEIMRPKSLARNIRITFIRKYKANLLIANSLKIYELFINLISNSIDAFENISDSRKRRINIILENDLKNNLVIKILDNGSGIDKENLEKIFMKKFSTKENGSGIGLSQAKEIVENDLNGKILVKSVLNQYTLFVIKIPKNRLII